MPYYIPHYNSNLENIIGVDYFVKQLFVQRYPPQTVADLKCIQNIKVNASKLCCSGQLPVMNSHLNACAHLVTV